MRIGAACTIGQTSIVCGHTIGPYAFVAAAAVVTSDVPPHALVAGVPARRIGWASHDGERLGPGLCCPRSGRPYPLVTRTPSKRGTAAEEGRRTHAPARGGPTAPPLPLAPPARAAAP